jgi:hypothetical protein
MRHRLRHALTIAALLILSAVTFAAAYSAISGARAERVLDDREALKAWMTSADAEHEPLSVRRHWVHRLEQDFRSDYDWQAVYDALPAEELHRFDVNFNELTRLMLMDKAVLWHSRQGKRREEYLETELPDLQNWKLIVNNSRARSKRGNSLLSELARSPDRWFADVTPAERKRLDEFRKALEQRTWSRELRRWLPMK